MCGIVEHRRALDCMYGEIVDALSIASRQTWEGKQPAGLREWQAGIGGEFMRRLGLDIRYGCNTTILNLGENMGGNEVKSKDLQK
uniref:Uncharacterized protein n=1 Tax=Heliothis virescens TaxID=7102 RepID=A0A2A4J6Z8_HELVI